MPAAPDSARRGWLLFAAVVAAAGLIQLTLFGYVAAPGLAGTSDSRYYLHAARAWRETGHLLNPDGTPYRYWPPLYPMLVRACGSLAGVRVLHGACLLGSLLLWSWLGRQLLPGRRVLLLPLLLALGTPGLLISKFVWSESVFMLLFAAYAASLYQWLRAGRGAWWVLMTVAGVLLPLERTLGLFLLAGIGVALGLSGWQRRQFSRRRWPWWGLHLGLSVAGGAWWQWYALHVGPSRYHPGRGWGALLSSAADYGFVLVRWLLLLPATGRGLLPNGVWAAGLLALFWAVWPRQTGPATGEAIAAGNRDHATSRVAPAAAATPDGRLLLPALWGACAALVALVAALAVFGQSAAGIHDAERYASVLFGPALLLGLAAWPGRLPRWLGAGAVGVVLLCSAVRVAHVAHDLRGVPPLTPVSGGAPGPHGQRIGAAGQ